MTAEALFVFVILLLSIILLSFLAVREGFENEKPSSITTSDGDVYTLASNSSNTNSSSNSSSNSDTSSNSSSNSDTSSNSNSNSDSNYDNYNHYLGSSSPITYYGPDGGTARVIQLGNSDTIVVTSKNGSTDIYYIDNSNTSNSITTSSASVQMYYGPNGASAKIITTSNGKKGIQITTANGTTLVYTADNNYLYSQNQDSSLNDAYAYNINQNYSSNTDSNTNTNTNTSTPSSTYSSSYNYSSYLPQGIPKSQIPPGQEDLYILKSEVVPPVCPACPQPIVQCPNNFDASKCPPCPPCARCPEQPFECKKVPNYNAFNPDYMPVPMFSDFNSFGM